MGWVAFWNLVLISLLQERRIMGQNPERFQEMERAWGERKKENERSWRKRREGKRGEVKKEEKGYCQGERLQH